MLVYKGNFIWVCEVCGYKTQFVNIDDLFCPLCNPVSYTSDSTIPIKPK